MQNKNQHFRNCAKEFCKKVQEFSNVSEVAIIGSVAGNDPYPNDIDIAIILRNFDGIVTIARYARQMSSYYPGWEVFVFNENLEHFGRICHSKECPAQSAECFIEDCGKIPHLKIISDFIYNEKKFFSSPFVILYPSGDKSLFLNHKKKLGITKDKTYTVMEDIKKICRDCGKEFIIDGSEQKWFKSRGMHLPARCEDCRLKRQFGESDDFMI